jgi:hypothetical protein
VRRPAASQLLTGSALFPDHGHELGVIAVTLGGGLTGGSPVHYELLDELVVARH